MFHGPYRFLPAILLVAVTLVLAPSMGLVRDLLFDALGAGAVKILAAALGLVAVTILGVAVARIDDRRPARYAALFGVAALLVLQTVGLGTGFAEVDVVEKIHILQYGGLAFLLYLALRTADRSATPATATRATATPATLALPLLWAGLAGVAEESVQGYFRFRVADIRDVWLNLLAAVCGLLLALALAPPDGWRFRRRDVGRILRAASLLVLAIGLFFSTVHLGHLVEDEDIGRFRSWFTQDELRRLSEVKARAWAARPPIEGAWQRKDYYLVEAAKHAQHRNASYRAGHWTHAWQANLILESYYPAFLDLPEYRGAGRHRYLPETRARLEAKATPDPATYLSAVHERDLRVWPQPLFLVGVLAVAVVLRVLSYAFGGPPRPGELGRRPGP